ncbi:MAG TPA: preprotein translocase subunit YajC [Bacteroidales bacterium]|nr:preprotein translocase subunit YajC [Bacteroidales bacterium]
MNMLTVLLQAPAGNPLVQLLPILLIIVVFYFFMIRPQMKRQKELKNFRDSLQKGDKVITTGGIYGRIVEIQDHVVFVEIDQNVKIKVDKAALLKDPSDIEQK